MRKNVEINDKALSDKRLTSEDFRVYMYLKALETGEEINIDEISSATRIDIKKVMKAIKILTVLGYTKDLDCMK